MKRIKFPLVMKSGVQVRNIKELRENFDIISVAKYFATGRLSQWLENNYCDYILTEVQKLTGNEEDFGIRLADVLGVTPNNQMSYDLKGLMNEAKLKEEIKRYVSEEALGEMEHIANSQQELEDMIAIGYQTIYLYGADFMIPRQMRDTVCIGINEPVVCVEAKNREEFHSQKTKLKGVKFVDDEALKIASDNPILDGYSGLIDVLDTYLRMIQRVTGGGK